MINMKDVVNICVEANAIIAKIRRHHPSEVRKAKDIQTWREKLQQEVSLAENTDWGTICHMSNEVLNGKILSGKLMYLYYMLDQAIANFRPPQSQLQETQSPAL